MPKYVIERDIPGVGKLTPSELMGISQKSCSVLAGLGPQIQWLHSYGTGDMPRGNGANGESRNMATEKRS